MKLNGKTVSSDAVRQREAIGTGAKPAGVKNIVKNLPGAGGKTGSIKVPSK